MALPRLTKIVVNMGVKDAVADKKNIEKMASVLSYYRSESKSDKSKKSYRSI